MYLETNQGRHNTNKVALSRFSASGDPQQTPHDINAELIKSAEFQAAGRTLGMSPEDLARAINDLDCMNPDGDDSCAAAAAAPATFDDDDMI